MSADQVATNTNCTDFVVALWITFHIKTATHHAPYVKVILMINDIKDYEWIPYEQITKFILASKNTSKVCGMCNGA